MIYQEGRVNPNTILFDAGLQGVKGVSGIYYVESENESCIIDSGDPNGAKRVIKTLISSKKSLPDKILLTHAHWDHSQGVPVFRKKHSDVQVLASNESIDLLRDQSFNEVFDKVPIKNISDVDPLKEGEIVNIGNLRIRTVSIPGHTYDHFGYFEEKNKIFFAGDAIGIRVGDKAYIPPCMPPFWNESQYYETLEKLNQMDIETLGLAHFGYVHRNEIPTFLEEMRNFYEISKKMILKVIEDPTLEQYLSKMIMEELNLEIPNLDTYDKKIPVILGVLNLFRRIVGKNPIHVGNILTPKFVTHALDGFKMSLKGK